MLFDKQKGEEQMFEHEKPVQSIVLWYTILLLNCKKFIDQLKNQVKK